MPSWSEVIKEIGSISVEHPIDMVRRQYLRTLYEYTGRNVIAYYSGFLQKPGAGCSIEDDDIDGLMQAIHGLDHDRGLDLILHTPGGNLSTAESIVSYLRSIFGNDIRAVVPQMAMSAGTMIALSCQSIVMGKQSNLGPIDPQFGGVSCGGVIEEFDNAVDQITLNPAAAAVWQPIISKYHPTFLGDCRKAIKWSSEIVSEWLLTNMFVNDKEAESKVDKIVSELSSHEFTYAHNRHIHSSDLKSLGLKVIDLEQMGGGEKNGCVDIQDCVLTIHHAYMHTFSSTNAMKIIENHERGSMIMIENVPG